jgi:transposase
MDASHKFWIGMDVSKDELVVAYQHQNENWIVKIFENSDHGIQTFIQHIAPFEQPHIVLEATGNYSMKVVFALCQKALAVSVLNPKQSKGFIQGVLLSTTKTDAKDACALALYGQVNQPKTFRLPSNKILDISQLRTLLRQLKKQLGSVNNQLHALQYHVRPMDLVLEKLNELRQLIEQQIKEVQQQLTTISKDCFAKAYQLTTSVVGVGPAIAQSLLIATNGLEDFDNAKQLAKFIGLCPSQHESGSSIRSRASITKTGDPSIRAAFYMGARSAKRYNQPCKMLYERLKAKGKCHKVAMTAVCNKMVHQIFAVVKSGQPFDRDYHLRLQK